MKKLTYEFVKEQFELAGCILLSTEYIGTNQLLDYICVCHAKAKIRYNSFKKGNRCRKCGTKRTHDKQRFTYEFVKQEFEKEGCILLSTEYIKSGDRLDYMCSCGNQAKISFSDFKREHRCKKCGQKKIGLKLQHSFEFVKSEFEKVGYILLSTEYTNSSQKLDYICSQGHQSQITFNDLKGGHGCMKCGGKEKLTYEYVYNYFKEQGCELLETEYIGAMTPMRYICNCKNESEIRFSSFKRGNRCLICGNKRSSKKRRSKIEDIKKIFEEANCILLSTEYNSIKQKLEYKCSCGSISATRLNDFKNGHRCGCEKSLGEVKVTNFLKEHNLKFEIEKKFEDCKNIKSLPFDFYLPEKNILIEYDGQQHYNSRKLFGGKTALEALQKRDAIKTAYCLDKNIKLIRIPYWDFDNIESILTKEIKPSN